MKTDGDPHKEFEKIYSKKHAGYVLITCDKPTGDGEMKVKLTYGGSAPLANMLLDGAQSYLDEEIPESDTIEPNIRLHKS